MNVLQLRGRRQKDTQECLFITKLICTTEQPEGAVSSKKPHKSLSLGHKDVVGINILVNVTIF